MLELGAFINLFFMFVRAPTSGKMIVAMDAAQKDLKLVLDLLLAQF